MAPKITDRTPPTVVTNGTPPLRASRLPPHLRLPILLVLNLGLQSALWTFASNFLTNELGEISRKPDENDMITPAARLVYKILVIWAGWRLSYDFVDISALTLVTNVPFAYLLQTYYDITPITVATLVAIEVASIALPTYLLRSRSAVNNANAPLRNRYLLQSFQVQTSNTLLALGVYVVTIFSSLKTDALTLFLVSHFDLPTLEAAHLETPFALVGKLIVAGYATKTFLLDPSIGATPASGEATPIEEFDPATATLPQTFKHNFWFFSRRTRTLIQQTAILSVFLFASTVQRCLSLSGTDLVGAAGYSSLFILVNVICAGWYGWVGDTDA